MSKFTVYLDLILLENLLMNYIILYATAIIIKKKINVLRIFISSLIGATFAILIYVVNIPIFSSIISKIILSIVMVYVGFKSKSFKALGKEILFFYLTSFVFGGVSLSLINVFSENGVSLEENTIKIILLGGIIGFVIVITAFKVVKTKISKKDMFCNLEIQVNNKKVNTTAMIDTGNLLKEPISNLPVIVVEHTLLYDCIPKEILNNLDEILAGNLENISDEVKKEYMVKLKVIPYKSLGKQNGMLLGIKAEKIKIDRDTEKKVLDKAIIGIYNKSLTKRGEYRALLGIEMI